MFNAINVDGGGSTSLALATPQPHVVNFPSSGPIGRAVGGNLGVLALSAYVQITNLTDGSSFSAPSELDVRALVLDTMGRVTNVAFYSGGSLLGSTTNMPYTLAWHNPAGGNYALQAVAMDDAGLNTTSAIVNITITCAAQPAPPANVAATAGAYCGVVGVSWSASNGATGYNVYRDGNFVAQAVASPYYDWPADTAIHSYVVTATYNCGQSPPGTSASGYALQVPSAPTGVSASAGTYCGTVQVSWTASFGAASYNVYRDGALVGNVVASPYPDTPGDTTNHAYMVSAVNGCGSSAASVSSIGYSSCPGDFSMAVSPLSQLVAPGAAAQYTVSVAPTAGFAGTVTFSVTGLPNGTPYSFSNPTVTGSGSTVLTITAPAGTNTVTIRGTSQSLLHQVTVTLMGGSVDFSVSASPASQTVSAGKSTTYTAQYIPLFGFNGVVSWSVTGLPNGVSASFTHSGSTTTLLTLNTARNARKGTFSLTIIGSSGALHHNATVTLIIR